MFCAFTFSLKVINSTLTYKVRLVSNKNSVVISVKSFFAAYSGIFRVICTGVYVLLSNILMVNLLVAMFR